MDVRKAIGSKPNQTKPVHRNVSAPEKNAVWPVWTYFRNSLRLRSDVTLLVAERFPHPLDSRQSEARSVDCPKGEESARPQAKLHYFKVKFSNM